ncbi:hypothetical protein RJT34_33166 [Clitoria ternatea]|uniref:Complex 1 LYR protein domain-containing protein n=1 Tax=Clitoria ternatea TaxID=43366 RepID=A0AAN9EZM7_CLITE
MDPYIIPKSCSSRSMEGPLSTIPNKFQLPLNLFKSSCLQLVAASLSPWLFRSSLTAAEIHAVTFFCFSFKSNAQNSVPNLFLTVPVPNQNSVPLRKSEEGIELGDLKPSNEENALISASSGWRESPSPSPNTFLPPPHHLHRFKIEFDCRVWILNRENKMQKRLSGMQKQVLSLYRGFLRAARSKSEPERRNIEGVVSQEFRRNSNQIDRKNFLYIEYLLRRGKKQLEQLNHPGTTGLSSLQLHSSIHPSRKN